MARAQQQKNWAEHEAATMWGTPPDRDIKLDSQPFDRMKELEDRLAQVKPRTILLARQLLGIVKTILAYKGEDSNPGNYFADGPVLDIVHNVLELLEYCKADLRVGPQRRQRDE
jgi:hypothetical protein